ncbi:hypothetical protein C8Q73DRAFT_631388, partial [Cubamyces lactineus]
ETLGAVALAVVIGLMLYGLTLHQVYRYFKMYPDDKPYLKTFVRVAFTSEPTSVVI